MNKEVGASREVRVLAATGMLGTGFSEASFNRALEWNPDVIGCDAGSTDPGPYYLGAGVPMSSREAVKRDLRIMIKGGLAKGIPVLVGSAGTAGGAPHVEWTVDIVKEIAAEEGLHFRLAEIQSEISGEKLIEYFRKGKMKPLHPAPAIDESSLRRITRAVAAMGPEPYIKALEEGAQVVIAGRSSDTAIYAAVPIMKRLNHGPTWHAAKILECGAGSVEQRLYPDCMMAWIGEDHFRVEPPNPEMKCTPVSVVSHTLYENADPFRLAEPSGVLDTSRATYHQDGERGVIVRASEFHHSPTYTVKVEGVQLAGYGQIAMGEIRDPVVIRQLDDFLNDAKNRIMEKVKTSLNLDRDSYRLHFRVLGDPRPSQGRKESEAYGVGVVIEVLAETREKAAGIMAIAWHTALHHPVKEWSGLVSQIAFPYSPPNADRGAVYQFCLNHVIEPDDPLELFPITMTDL